MVQAGTELFTESLRGFLPSEIVEDAQGRKVGKRNIADRVRMPAREEASKAWKWLQEQRKPFYIGQLHLIRGWSALAEWKAERDAKIAVVEGLQFVPKKKTKKGRMSVVTEESSVKVSQHHFLVSGRQAKKAALVLSLALISNTT